MKYCMFTLTLCLELLSISARAELNAKKDWKTIQNKNGWSIQYPKNWLNNEESDSFGEGKASKDTASEYWIVLIRSPEAQASGQAAWIEIKAQSSKDSKNLNVSQTSAKTKINVETPEATVKNLKNIIEKYSVAGDLQSTENGHEVNFSGNIGYDEVITKKEEAGNKEHIFSYRLVKIVKIPEHNKTISITYHEGDNSGFNELPRSAWKFEKTFDQILSTLNISD